MTDEPKLKATNPEVLTVPVQWEAVSFPKTRANCGKFTLVSLSEIMNKEDRDIYRHLVDDDSSGHMIYVPDGVDPNKVEVPNVTARAQTKDKKAMTPGSMARFLLGLIWDEGTDHSEPKEAFYEREMGYINRQFGARLDDIRRLRDNGESVF